MIEDYYPKCVECRTSMKCPYLFDDDIDCDKKKFEEEIRTNERNKVIAEIRVGLGKVQRYECETEDNYICIDYYKADKVLSLLRKVGDNNG